MINHWEESMRIGHNLKKIRLQKGLMQIDLATTVDLNRTYISRVETGKARVTTGLISRLVKGLEITSKELIKDENIVFAGDTFYWDGGEKNS